MEYRQLGTSGLQVSAIGLGTNNFGGRTGREASRAVLDRALDQGITFIDTADVYGGTRSETLIGEFLGHRRHDVVLTTKFGVALSESPYMQGTSRHYVVRAVEASLRRLRTDYIDLYMIHRPDPKTPILETLQALDDLVHQGKIRYICHSNFAAWQIVDAQWTAKSERLTRPVAAQHPYSLLDRSIEPEVLPAIRAMGLGLIPYFPLAAGFLTGKYRPGQLPPGSRLSGAQQAHNRERLLTDANFELLGKLEKFADERAHSMVDLAFAWLLSKPEVGSVIAGATRPDQIDENVRAGNWRLTLDEQAEVEQLLK